MTQPIIVVGDAMLDITSRVTSPIAVETDTYAHNAVHCGGAAANVAVGLAHLGQRVTFVGSVGDDPAGDLLVREFDRHGVGTQIQRSRHYPTGSCVVLVDPAGERSMLSDSGANRDLMIDPDAFVGARHVHISGYIAQYPQSLAQLHAALAHRTNASVSIDIASISVIELHRPTMVDLVTRADVAFGTDGEFEALGCPQPAGSLWVVKSGRNGVVVRGSEQARHSPAPQVSVINTTGAGDAFAAGFLAAWLANGDIDDALALARAEAASALTRVGAWPLQSGTAG